MRFIAVDKSASASILPALAASLGLHALIIGAAVWHGLGTASTLPDTRFAPGEQALSVPLQLSHQDDVLQDTVDALPQMLMDHTEWSPPASQPVAMNQVDADAIEEHVDPISYELPAVVSIPAPLIVSDSITSDRNHTAAASSEPVGVISEAEPIDLPTPRYPAASQRRGETGTVWLEATVTSQGTVTAVRVIDSPGYPLLEQAAQDALSRARFRPALRDEKPIASRVRIPFRFELRS